MCLGCEGTSGVSSNELMVAERQGNSARPEVGGSGALPFPLGPLTGAGGGGGAEKTPTTLSSVVSAACSFLQVTPSRTGR